jgi:hypothetical protein
MLKYILYIFFLDKNFNENIVVSDVKHKTIANIESGDPAILLELSLEVYKIKVFF